MSYLWKIGGEAGFGIMTTGLFMAKIAARSGYRIFDYSEYPSLIRGGHNTYEVHISSGEIGSSKHEIDMLVCLNKTTFELHTSRLTKQSIIVHDPDVFIPKTDQGILVSLPIKKILLEHRTSSVMANTIALGGSLFLMGTDLSLFEGLMKEIFGKKGDDVFTSNVLMAQKGFEYVKQHYNQYKKDVLVPTTTAKKTLVLSGNEAFGLACIIADCRMYVAYPMTPASSVQTYLASIAEQTGMIVRHAEDEISVINTALGSSFAGVRSSIGTSGGGFALMAESVSFAGMAEIPIVIFLSQRPGPATGMPTWTEQGDLLFAVHAGHGDFPKIVLAPGDPLEMIQLGIKAFDLADQYQLPVIVLSDKVLSESHKSVSLDDWNALISAYSPDRGKILDSLSNASPYLRYKLVEDGISPMLIPGNKDTFYQTNSYEHKEDSHTTEDMKERKEQADKRARKIETYLKRDFVNPSVFGDLKKSDIVLISWGGNKGVVMEAQKVLKQQGIKTAYIHFTYLYPLNREKMDTLLGLKKKYILIENNQSGQFGKLLREQTGYSIEEKLLKYDGQPIFVEEIVSFVINKSL